MASPGENPALTAGRSNTWAKAKAASHQMILQAALEDLETKAAKLEKEIHDCKIRLGEKDEKLLSKTTQVEKLTSELEETNAKLVTTRQELAAKSSECKSLEESAKTNEERVDRQAVESDALREEISRLNKSNQEYKEKVMELETQAKLGDSEIIPLRYQAQRLTSEMDSMSAHTKWLESELNSKNDQLAAMRASHASEVAQLRSELDAAVTAKETSSGQVSNLKHELEMVQAERERLSTELRETRTSAADEKMSMEQNLVSSQRLVSLQKEQIERLQQRHDSLAGQMEALQKLAKQAEEEGNQELQQREQALEAQTKKVLEDQANDYQNQIRELKDQLAEAERRRKHAEDGLLLTDVPTWKATPQKTLAIKDKENEDEPLNLTDLHSRLAKAQDEVAAENLRRRKAEIQLSRIRAEIEANAPVLIRQRQEYEVAMERYQEYRRRLDEALAEVQSAREEASEMSVESSRLRKQNRELQEEITELAKQVQTLLVSRSSAEGAETGSVPSSVAEMQAQNQQLLKDHRRLTATIEELKQKLESDSLRRKVEEYEKEINTLTEHRKQQQTLVESIVQQRDLYRAILNKQDNNLLSSESDEVSALQIVKQQSERTKSLEEQKKRLEAELVTARAELDSISRNMEAMRERVSRYESLNGELTSTVDRLQLQVSSSKADVARSEADASFHREKSARLEETLQRARDEVTRVTASKNEMQRINADLQKSLSKANSDSNQMESELQQANMKLRLAETQAATARASEQRLAEENKQLRLENSRQGGLNETVLRLEASLSARSAAEVETLKADITSLKEKLSAESTARATEKEKAEGKIADQELRIKDLERQKEEAIKNALKAKEESLAAAAEIQKITTASKTMESQLRLAKKKLGDTGIENDAESDLSAKVVSLTAELDAKRKEIETLKERVTTFEKLSKENEQAVAALKEASSASQTSEANEIERLKSELEIVKSETAKRKELITELTNDLAKNRDERTEALAELNKKISLLQGEAENHQKNAQAAEDRYTQLEAEVSGLRKEISTSQNNYERELALHAAARTELRAAREEAEAEIRLRKIAEEQVVSLKNEQGEMIAQIEQEKVALENKLSESEKTLAETRAQNALLHGQLEKIGEQVEKMQAGKIAATEEVDVSEGNPDEIFEMKKTITDLREVVKFVRTENEMIQAQLDAAKRTAERERAATAVAKRSLDEAREELKLIQESLKEADSGDGNSEALKEKLLDSQEQARLLRDSNSHLRDEVARLEQKSSALEDQLSSLKNSAQPSEKRLLELESEKAALVAEKDSLLREINDWKGRVQSLVSKFNQVDPEEHTNVLKKVELLEKEVAELKTKKVEAEEESKRIRTLASRASSQLQQNKNLVEAHKKTIAKLTAEKDALSKVQKDVASSKEFTELKEKMTKLEADRENEKIQLNGANEMNEKLRDRLRQFQKTIMELRKKESSLVEQQKEAQEKIEKLEKLKVSPIAGQAATQETKDSKPGDQSGSIETKASADTAEKAEGKVQPPTSTSGEDSKTHIVPMVPAEGFRFGPSPPEEDKGSSVAEERSKSPVPGKTPESGAGNAAVSKKRPAESTETESDIKKVAKSEEKAEKPAEGALSPKKAPSEEEKASEILLGTPKAERRDSGQTKELSMKERLLEKKRKLMLAMQKKKEEEIRKQALAKADDSDTPAMKKPKTEGGGEVGFETNEDTKEETKKAEESKAEGEVEEGEEGEADEPKLDENQGKNDAPAKPAPATSSISNPFAAAAAAPFGSGGIGLGSGSGPTFGQTSTFGSGAAFGASSFGKKSETSGGGFGGFMNIKPPGSSTTPPTFTFGTSASITLPTPSSISPQQSMFNAFSSPNPFNTGGVTPKPLFGLKKEKSGDAKEEEKGETKDPE